jgi:phosphatidate cytidylyltransferase
MAADPVEQASQTPQARSAVVSDLRVRALSGVVMAAVAIVLTLYGGTLFALFWIAAAGVVFWEWYGLVASESDRMKWLVGGACYALVIAGAPILLRNDPQYGFISVFFLFAVVWGTDIAAYFGGRYFGGPHLAPAISPHKTWSGAVTGMLGAVVAGTLVAIFGALPTLPAAILAALLSVASQAGDLFESHLKRRFGVKDTSQIIPGHGGVMDRLDGFVAAAGVAALLGLLRDGFAHPGRGMLSW